MIAKVRGNSHVGDVAPRCVQVHLVGPQRAVCRPMETPPTSGGHRGVRLPSHGILHRDQGRVVHDEISPNLLEYCAEVLVGCLCTDGEVGGKIGSMISRRDRVLVFPRSAGPLAEGLGQPLRRAVVQILGGYVEDGLLDSSSHFRYRQGCRALVA